MSAYFIANFSFTSSEGRDSCECQREVILFLLAVKIMICFGCLDIFIKHEIVSASSKCACFRHILDRRELRIEVNLFAEYFVNISL